MLKGVLRELLPKYVPFGRGGALGATGIGLVGNILCCSNWALQNIRYHRLIHIHVVSVLPVVEYQEG